MKVYVINPEIIFWSHSMYKFLDVFMILTVMGFAETCSPPNRKTDDFVRASSLLERAEEARIIIVGSVVEFDHHDQFSVTARVAVHVKLKGENVSRIVNVSGFNANRNKDHKKTMFHPVDCTGTSVDLYGTYLFFIKRNRNKRSYTIDKIQMQPAAERIPCNRQDLSKDINRLLKKFRRQRPNDIKCFVTTRTRTKTIRNCLRKRWRPTFWRLIHKFTYGNMRTRTVYCSTKQQSNLSVQPPQNRRRTGGGTKINTKLNDYIPMRKLYPHDAAGVLSGTRGHNKDVYAATRSRTRRHFVYTRTDTTISVFTTSRRHRRYPRKSSETLSTAVRKQDIKVISDWEVVRKSTDNILVSSSASTLRTQRTLLGSRILTLSSYLAVASYLINLIF